MPKERRSDWCWSNETLLIIPVVVIIASVVLWNIFTPRPKATFGAGWEIVAVIFIGSFFVTCYLCGKMIEIASEPSSP